MSKSQKVLRVFGILEIVMAVLGVVGIVLGGSVSAWTGVAVAAVSAYLLLAAAKDASKVMGAWVIVQVDLILAAIELVLAITDNKGTEVVVGSVVAIILSLIEFIAANNVKKQTNL